MVSAQADATGDITFHLTYEMIIIFLSFTFLKKIRKTDGPNIRPSATEKIYIFGGSGKSIFSSLPPTPPESGSKKPVVSTHSSFEMIVFVFH